MRRGRPMRCPAGTEMVTATIDKELMAAVDVLVERLQLNRSLVIESLLRIGLKVIAADLKEVMEDA